MRARIEQLSPAIMEILKMRLNQSNRIFKHRPDTDWEQIEDAIDKGQLPRDFEVEQPK